MTACIRHGLADVDASGSFGLAETAEQRKNSSDLAERVGFEPTVRNNRTPDFESGAFDHSATSPSGARVVTGGAEYSKAAGCAKPPAAKPRQVAGSSFSAPPRYGRSTSGTVTLPSAFW